MGCSVARYEKETKRIEGTDRGYCQSCGAVQKMRKRGHMRIKTEQNETKNQKLND